MLNQLQSDLTPRPLLALSVTLAVQTLAALSQSTPAVLAPVISQELSIGAQHIGNFTGVLYIFAMLSGLVLSARIESFGALRFSQLAMLVCSVGLAVSTVGHTWAFVVAACLIGVGYGLANPTAASILGRHAPRRHRGLLFSIKQTGVPLGIALAGLLVPAVLAAYGWRAALLLSAGLCALCALAIQPSAAVFDRARSRATDGKSPFAPLMSVLANPIQRLLALTSLIYGCTQVCFLVFLVAFLTLQLNMTLGYSAFALAAAQLASVIARPFWGWLGDRTGEPGRLLGALGIAAGCACCLLGTMPPDASAFRVIATVMFCGLTAVGWNGVFFAELVRHAELSEVATLTGGVQFMTFGGAMTGPVLFALSISLGASYATTFIMLSVLPVIAGAVLLHTLWNKT
jgi:MFS family permease